MTDFLNFVKHAVAGSTKLSATRYGRHIFNIKVDQDMDNGTIVATGDLVAGTLDVYKAKASTGFAGIVDGKAANGNFYVRVTAPGDAVLLLNPELIYENWTSMCNHPSNYYNAKGSIVRGYQLEVNDVFELSAEGFTADVAVGNTVTVDATTMKLVPAAAAGEGGTV